MKKNLTAFGTHLGLIFDEALITRYELDSETMVEVLPDEQGITLRFLKDDKKRAGDDEVMKAAEDINKRYEKMMKNLAK